MAVKPISLGTDDNGDPLTSANFRLEGGADGMRLLSAYDFVGEESCVYDSIQEQERKRRGLRALEAVGEVSIVAIPDINVQPVQPPSRDPLPVCEPVECVPVDYIPPAEPPPPAEIELPPRFNEDDIYLVQASLVQQCEERRDRIALLDPPFSAASNRALGISAARAWRSRFDTRYAAFYFPWLYVVDPLRSANELVRAIPPSGHAAGQYARTDMAIGVHAAPANESLNWVQDVTAPINDAVHGILNPEGINAIRVMQGRGIRIMGARTVSSDPDWKYVNVRRLLMMVREAVDISTQWAAFEPNDDFTRSKLHLSLTSFLLALWQSGALAGTTAQQAFFVKCDAENNPPHERENGRLVAEIGVAPAQPFEFVVLRLQRVANELEIAESARYLGGR